MDQKSDYQTHIDAEISDNVQNLEMDPYRLDYHLMPPVGLLNDPNGLIQFNGTYHVFFQWNPFETTHGKKAWGHYTSRDLINWTLEPAALVPDAWYDKNGCYSGSAIEHDGKIYLFYTGNVKDDEDRRSTYQCLAVSEDGIHFGKKGPVLHLPDGYTPHFRDPKVWKTDGQWLMILGAQNEQGHGEAVIAASENLVDWDFIGPIAGSNINGLGDFGYMWECPDLFELDGRDILIVCPQGLEADGDKYHNLFQAGYFTGAFDSSMYTYNHGDFTELDRGFDFYAPQTFTDEAGRRILLAWMGITDDDEQDQPTIGRNWIHGLTIPRVLEMKGDKVIQNPAPELQKLRDERVSHAVMLNPETSFHAGIEPLSEISMDFKNDITDGFEMVLRNDVRVIYDGQRFIIERRKFSGEGREQRAFQLEQLANLRIFLDRSSVEIFVNGGEEVCSSRFFPEVDERNIELKARGAVQCEMTVWNLKENTIDMY
ncbi:glycoside hydrolase family 32 protein [Salinicoccus roseus]|uniref:glycoside hydrolase family 32 protein n=1 Tax=Salinicoccus roseus TaxID=45670 RepID=UPI000F4D8285|nr:sucrose-6-phosphate hydrolase [Salinicoccus roseus]RPE51785.1 beta-fructofuranosidase [Salinicoccus roseus]GGA76135.1 sucrose-6-phosphate hydrolase [Salinicoccus roseus]